MKFEEMIQSISDPALRNVMQQVISCSVNHSGVSSAKLQSGLRFLRRSFARTDPVVEQFFESDDTGEDLMNTEELLDISTLDSTPHSPKSVQY